MPAECVAQRKFFLRATSILLRVTKNPFTKNHEGFFTKGHEVNRNFLVLQQTLPAGRFRIENMGESLIRLLCFY